jgi:hypothetical protein
MDLADAPKGNLILNYLSQLDVVAELKSKDLEEIPKEKRRVYKLLLLSDLLQFKDITFHLQNQYPKKFPNGDLNLEFVFQRLDLRDVLLFYNNFMKKLEYLNHRKHKEHAIPNFFMCMKPTNLKGSVSAQSEIPQHLNLMPSVGRNAERFYEVRSYGESIMPFHIRHLDNNLVMISEQMKDLVYPEDGRTLEESVSHTLYEKLERMNLFTIVFPVFTPSFHHSEIENHAFIPLFHVSAAFNMPPWKEIERFKIWPDTSVTLQIDTPFLLSAEHDFDMSGTLQIRVYPYQEAVTGFHLTCSDKTGGFLHPSKVVPTSKFIDIIQSGADHRITALREGLSNEMIEKAGINTYLPEALESLQES